MLKKIGLVAFASVMALAITTSCSKAGKYADAKEAMEEMSVIFEDFSASMEKTKDAKGMAAAMDKFSAGILKMTPKLKEIEKKYPEMKSKPNEVPAELKDTVKKMEAAGEKLAKAMMGGDAMKYMMSPEVMESAKKMQEAMAGLSK